MPRTPVATDDFNRAGPGLGSDWLNLGTGVVGDVTIASNEFVGASTLGMSAARWVGSGSFVDDQYSSAVFADSGFGDAAYGIGVICRASSRVDALRDFYYHYAGSADISAIGKMVGGVDTLFHTAAQVWNDGDRVELEVEGTTIRAMRNGVALGGSFTQTDGALITGNAGIGASGTGAVATGDNWEGGNLAGGPELGHGERAAVRLLRPN